MIKLETLDVSVIAIYFAIIFLTAFVVTKKEKKEENSEDYFLAGRNLGWFLIGSSLFASNIGSEHLIGLAGSGASGGVAVAQFEILACFILLLLGWFFVPFYIKSGVTTMPEFLEKRYSPAARMYLSIISVLAYVITKISATIYAGAIVFQTIGVDFWTGAFIVVVATGVYTIFGGLRAVIYTDTIQMVIMILGSILLTVLGLEHIGGFAGLKQSTPDFYFSMWRPMSDPDFPWTGILFGAPILGIWYWCTDQFVVQRVLSAKNIHHARRGSFFGGFLKVLPLFIFVIPGMIAFVLAQQGNLNLESNDQALPALIGSIIPNGLKGLMIAGLLAALMSSLSSVFNSCSTLITYDFYKKLKPKTSEKQLVRFGQMATLVLVILGMAWIPLMKVISGQLFTYLQKVQAYISPPIAVVFLLGICFRRLNSRGAMACLWTGFFLGIGRLGLELFQGSLAEGSLFHAFVSINFLHFALLLFIVCSVVLVVVSLLSPSETTTERDHLSVNWSNRLSLDSETTMDIALSAALVTIVLSLWWYFS